MSSENQRKWRIAHSESSLGWGGQEHRVLAELTGFKDRGCDVWLVAPADSVIFTRARELRINVRPADFRRGRFLQNVVSLARWLRKAEIQVLNPHSSQDGWVLGLAGKLARVPLIIRTRHIDVEYRSPGLSRHAFTTLCDHVLTTSDKITEHFRSTFGLPADRISTVPTGIDIRRFAPAGPRADLPGMHPRKIGMISVLRSWKGHSTFIDAAKLLLDSGFEADFLITGEGPGKEKIERYINNLGLSGNVRLLGHREDVPAILRGLNLLAIPSTRHEGVPQIGLQALATRTAVVGSSVGGIPEIIRPGETGRIVPPSNPADLAQAIREAFAEPERTEAMKERGRAMVEKNHSLEHMFERLETLYQKYLGA